MIPKEDEGGPLEAVKPCATASTAARDEARMDRPENVGACVGPVGFCINSHLQKTAGGSAEHGRQRRAFFDCATLPSSPTGIPLSFLRLDRMLDRCALGRGAPRRDADGRDQQGANEQQASRSFRRPPSRTSTPPRRPHRPPQGLACPTTHPRTKDRDLPRPFTVGAISARCFVDRSC